jgi:hypothetical protein
MNEEPIDRFDVYLTSAMQALGQAGKLDGKNYSEIGRITFNMALALYRERHKRRDEIFRSRADPFSKPKPPM